MKVPLRLLGPLSLVFIWSLISFFNMVDPLMLPGPWLVFKRLLYFFTSLEIITPLLGTLYRTIIGTIGAIIVGVPIGVIMGYWLHVYRSFELLIDFFRSLPATALFPLFMLWFGLGDTSKIVLVIFSSSLIVLVYSYYGVKHASREKKEVTKTFGASSLQYLMKVALPEALPEISSGIRVSISLCLILVVVTEMLVGGDNGLGVLIYNTRYAYRTADLFAVIILTGILGYCLNQFVLALEKRIIHWSGK